MKKTASNPKNKDDLKIQIFATSEIFNAPLTIATQGLAANLRNANGVITNIGEKSTPFFAYIYYDKQTEIEKLTNAFKSETIQQFSFSKFSSLNEINKHLFYTFSLFDIAQTQNLQLYFVTLNLQKETFYKLTASNLDKFCYNLTKRFERALKTAPQFTVSLEFSSDNATPHLHFLIALKPEQTQTVRGILKSLNKQPKSLGFAKTECHFIEINNHSHFNRNYGYSINALLLSSYLTKQANRVQNVLSPNELKRNLSRKLFNPQLKTLLKDLPPQELQSTYTTKDVKTNANEIYRQFKHQHKKTKIIPLPAIQPEPKPVRSPMTAEEIAAFKEFRKSPEYKKMKVYKATQKLIKKNEILHEHRIGYDERNHSPYYSKNDLG
ncbi:MAG: hypothetical protein WBI40_13030 [Methylococcaceae bacterium]